MPQMNEGDLLYMPSALPGISTARPVTANLRVHRAGPGRTQGRAGLRARCIRKICIWIGHELGPATDRAEMIALSMMRSMVLGRRRIDEHPAHRVASLALAIQGLETLQRTAPACSAVRCSVTISKNSK